MINYIILYGPELCTLHVQGNYLHLTKEEALYSFWARDLEIDGDEVYYLMECEAHKIRRNSFLITTNRLLAIFTSVKTPDTTFEDFLNTLVWYKINSICKLDLIMED
jgi:hypothetical protein